MKLHFENGFHGVTQINQQRIEMNRETGVGPYDLTFAAIGGCFYATFLDQCDQLHLSVEWCDLEVTGIKRQTVPTTLETVDITVTIKTMDSIDAVTEAFDQASAQCSMLAMVRSVAEVNIQLYFA